MRIITGDALAALRGMRAGSVQCCVTSPPYWGLRDYGVPGQLGLEPTPEAYVSRLVAVFREVRRVLKDDGTLWLNLGDCYNSQPGQRSIEDKHGTKQASNRGSNDTGSRNCPTLKPKDLVGIPWRVAFALQADGWFLRSDIIWHKPNPMPESVRDRPTKAHEYLFLLAKSERYRYDCDAIAEPVEARNLHDLTGPGYNAPGQTAQRGNRERNRGGRVDGFSKCPNGYRRPDGMRNKRSVWTVTPKPFKGAHFATFPPKLIEPCILAGSGRGDVVLDPFNGAGTTGLVAEAHGRRYVGIELNPEYVALTRERLEAA